MKSQLDLAGRARTTARSGHRRRAVVDVGSRRVRGFGVLGCRPRREQAHRVVRRSAGLDGVDEQQLVLIGQSHRL
jgi:hypothetical protein